MQKFKYYKKNINLKVLKNKLLKYIITQNGRIN